MRRSLDRYKNELDKCETFFTIFSIPGYNGVILGYLDSVGYLERKMTSQESR